MVLENDVEDHFDRSCEEWWSTTQRVKKERKFVYAMKWKKA